MKYKSARNWLQTHRVLPAQCAGLHQSAQPRRCTAQTCSALLLSGCTLVRETSLPQRLVADTQGAASTVCRTTLISNAKKLCCTGMQCIAVVVEHLNGKQTCKKLVADTQGAASTMCRTAVISSARLLCCTELQCIAAEWVHTCTCMGCQVLGSNAAQLKTPMPFVPLTIESIETCKSRGWLQKQFTQFDVFKTSACDFCSFNTM